MNVALGLLLSGEPEQAEAKYRRFLELEPDNPKATKELADAVAAQDRYDDAVELYRQAIIHLANAEQVDAIEQRPETTDHRLRRGGRGESEEEARRQYSRV